MPRRASSAVATTPGLPRRPNAREWQKARWVVTAPPCVQHTAAPAGSRHPVTRPARTCTQPQPTKARAHTGTQGPTVTTGHASRRRHTRGRMVAPDMTTARCTSTLHKPKLTWPLLLAAHCKPATATQPPERSRPVAVGPRTARPSHFEQPQITAADLPAPSAGPLTPAECFCYGLAPCMPAPPSLWHVSRRGVE